MALTTALVTTVGAQAYSIDRQREAAKDQRRAARIEKRKSRIQNARERRRAAAEAQVLRSRVAAEQSAGGFTTSGQTQQVGAINSQLAGNTSFSKQIERMNMGIINAQTSASGAQTQAAYGQAVAGLSGQLGFSVGSQIQSGMANGSFFASPLWNRASAGSSGLLNTFNTTASPASFGGLA